MAPAENGNGQPVTRNGNHVDQLIAGRYLLHEILGKGGMGTVWRAHDELLDRPVAAKVLHIVAHSDEEQRIRVRRATREARAVARIQHPHVIGVYDLVESGGRLWIMMELVAGPSLAHRIAEAGPFSPRHTAVLGLQLLDALEAVHAAGAVHRDVKPANVLLRRDDNAVLTDFGIAALDDGESLTTTGELIGSLEYMAPERVTGTEIGPASDLWSLGATLSALCEGHSPFRKSGQPATLHAVAYEEPALSERLGPLRPIVESLLLKSPHDRPSIADARAALRDVAEGEQDSPPLPPPTAGVPRPSQSVADADTLTRHEAHEVTASHFTPTTVHTTSVGAGPKNPSRSARAKRAWPVLAGTVTLAAGAVGSLFLTGALPHSSAPGTATVNAVDVESTLGWQKASDVALRPGDQVTVRFIAGKWTVDHRNMPMTGPAGYDTATDTSLGGAKSCKVDPDAPFGTLLTRIAGKPHGPVRSVKDNLTFQASTSGTLQLSINDATGPCSQDNKGALKVEVSITRRR
ncbi:serine/threonine-protein kinase [Streptomyces sp. NPDC007084]|uniref:serine/threonine-protein kinase n=1 Tax=Streptomyces sp. NPDC007084 TaxID=3154313 RepID=UPI003455AA1A